MYLLRYAIASLALLIASLSTAFAAPLVINACTTISVPGSYVLGNNLSAAGDCIVIAADFVTVDHDGFVITGLKPGSGITAIRGGRGTVVRNGTITGFTNGILLDKAVDVVVERVNAFSNSNIGIDLGDGAEVRASRAEQNGNNGFSLGQRALVTGSSANENGNAGIMAAVGANIVGNLVGRNKGTGIMAVDGANVVNNMSRNNGLAGIYVDCPSAVIGNTSGNNLGANLVLNGGACTADHNSTL
jgi:hypothetical protein